MKLATLPFILIGALLVTSATLHAQMAWQLVYDDPNLLPRTPSLSCSNDGNCIAVGSAADVDFFPSIVRTTDGGSFWLRQPHGLPFVELVSSGGNGLTVQLYDVEMIDSTHAIVVGAQGAILRTSDAGATWIREDSLTNVSLTTVSFSDPLHGLAASAVRTHDTIYLTSDGGVTWTPKQVGSIGFDVVHAISPTRMMALNNLSSQGNYYYTSNGGTTWTYPQPMPIGGVAQRSWYPSFSFLDSNTGFAAAVIPTGGGTFDKVFRTTNGGARWTSVYSQPVSGGGMLAIRFTDTSNGIAVTKLGAIYRTTNGGAAWERTVPNPFDLLGGQSLLSVSFIGRNIYAITNGGRFLAYRNTGALVGIEPGRNERLHLFPNPAASAVTVELPEEIALAPGSLHAVIIDMLGRDVRRMEPAREGARVRLDVGDLPRGIYRLLLDAGSRSATGGFVVR